MIIITLVIKKRCNHNINHIIINNSCNCIRNNSLRTQSLVMQIMAREKGDRCLGDHRRCYSSSRTRDISSVIERKKKKKKKKKRSKRQSLFYDTTTKVTTRVVRVSADDDNTVSSPKRQCAAKSRLTVAFGSRA